MTEPPQQPPYPPPSPFNPPGVRPEVPGRPPGATGCSKPLLIGCGALLLLLGIGLVVMISNAPKIVQWSFRTMEQDIMSRLGPDVTPEDRARLAAAFEDARRSMEKNQIDISKVQAFQGKIMDVAPAGRKLSRKDIQELTQSLEGLAGKPPTPDPSPAERERGGS
ncbi:MAG TPA: hypothetical protein VKM72_05060 [Thermoanaerobaculia bacterium]|nr:hypothetical protein [Thermoanaerobaculia bacterium]